MKKATNAFAPSNKVSHSPSDAVKNVHPTHSGHQGAYAKRVMNSVASPSQARTSKPGGTSSY